jgi:hypothetical protein
MNTLIISVSISPIPVFGYAKYWRILAVLILRE